MDRRIKQTENTAGFPIDSRGFTLLEILISLAISGIVLSGIFYVFDTSNKSYIVQEDIARMQQNIRIAKYYIEKDLRMAAYGIRELAYNQTIVEPLVFKNNISDAAVLADTDSISISYIDDAADDCGTPSAGTNSCDDNPQLLLDGSMPDDATAANIKEELGAGSPYASWTESCECNGTLYTKPKFSYKVIITAPDGSMSDVLILTGAKDTGGGDPDNLLNGPNETVDSVNWPNKVLNEYPENSTINFFNDNSLVTARYFIDDEGFLRREVGGVATKVAENMEDLQMAFCGDYNGDGTVDVDDAADWYSNANLTAAGEMQAAHLDEIRYVRVTLLARTSRQHEGVSSTRPTIEDHAGAVQSDLYSRRQLSFTVRVRNLGLGS